MESDIDFIGDASVGMDKIRTEVGCERDGRAGNLIMPVGDAGNSQRTMGPLAKCSCV